MSIEEKRREAFEARIRISHPDDYAEDGERIFKREGAGYDWHWVNEYWLCWNDALDSIVVELPSLGICGMNNELLGYQRGIRDCRAAIEACGLKVKV